MKTKLLKQIRKYFEYKFCKGQLLVRRKCDGDLTEYRSIREFMSYYIYENVGMSAGSNWRKRKNAIADRRRWNESC